MLRGTKDNIAVNRKTRKHPFNQEKRFLRSRCSSSFRISAYVRFQDVYREKQREWQNVTVTPISLFLVSWQCSQTIEVIQENLGLHSSRIVRKIRICVNVVGAISRSCTLETRNRTEYKCVHIYIHELRKRREGRLAIHFCALDTNGKNTGGNVCR